MNITGGSDRVFGTAVALTNVDEWFNLKVEVFVGDMNSTLAKVYANDELVLVTNNYKGFMKNTATPVAPSTDVSKAYFYTYGDAVGTILFDNVAFDMRNTPKGEYTINDPRPEYVAP